MQPAQKAWRLRNTDRVCQNDLAVIAQMRDGPTGGEMEGSVKSTPTTTRRGVIHFLVGALILREPRPGFADGQHAVDAAWT